MESQNRFESVRRGSCAMAVPPGLSSVAGVPLASSPAFTWEWHNEKAGVWVPYPPAEVDRLNTAYARGDKVVVLSQPNYSVSFEKTPYLQTNSLSGNSHEVRRVAHPRPALAVAPVAPVPSAPKITSPAVAKPAPAPTPAPVSPSPTQADDLRSLCALAFERPADAAKNTRNLALMSATIKCGATTREQLTCSQEASHREPA